MFVFISNVTSDYSSNYNDYAESNTCIIERIESDNVVVVVIRTSFLEDKLV